MGNRKWINLFTNIVSSGSQEMDYMREFNDFFSTAHGKNTIHYTYYRESCRYTSLNRIWV